LSLNSWQRLQFESSSGSGVQLGRRAGGRPVRTRPPYRVNKNPRPPLSAHLRRNPSREPRSNASPESPSYWSWAITSTLSSERRWWDYAEIAHLTGLTRARVTQITNLTLLAPEIQEVLLLLPSDSNEETLTTEHHLRRIIVAIVWCAQRQRWNRHSCLPACDS